MWLFVIKYLFLLTHNRFINVVCKWTKNKIKKNYLTYNSLNINRKKHKQKLFGIHIDF